MPKFEHVEAGVYKVTEDKMPLIEPNSILITKEEAEELVRFIENNEFK